VAKAFGAVQIETSVPGQINALEHILSSPQERFQWQLFGLFQTVRNAEQRRDFFAATVPIISLALTDSGHREQRA